MVRAAPFRPQRSLALALGFALLATCAGAVAVAASNPSMDALLIGAIAVVLLAPLVARAVLRRFDPLEPLLLIAIAYGVMFVVRPLAVLSSGNYKYPISSIAAVNFHAGFSKMLTVGLVGATSLVIGYLIPTGRRLAVRAKRPPVAVDPEWATLAAATCAAVGFMGFLIFIFESGGASALATYLSGRSTLLTQLQVGTSKYLIFGPILLVSSTLILLTIGVARRTAAPVLMGLAAAAMLLLVAAPIGSRSMLLPLVLGAAIITYHARGTRPRVITLVVAALIALFVSSTIGTVRTATVRQTQGISQTVQTLVAHPSRIFDPIVRQEDAAESTGLAALFSLPPGTLPAMNGKATIGDLLTRAIPRSIWPSKPDPPRQVASRALFGRTADTFIADPEYSVLLYPYLDGGYVGVLALLLTYGIAIRGLWEYLQIHTNSTFARLLFALAAPALVAGLRDGPVDTFARIAFLLIPLFAAFFTSHLFRISGSEDVVARRLDQPGAVRAVSFNEAPD